MKTASAHNAPQLGESDLIPYSGLKTVLLERFFNERGFKLRKIKVVMPPKPKPKRKRKK